WPGDSSVQLRIGLHTGEPMLGKEGYLGLDVVRAARLCRIAHGGHILISETTRALVRTTLPEGVSLLPAGKRQLKGIDHPEPVSERGPDGVDERLPIPAALEREIEQRFGRVGLRIAARLGEHVTDSFQEAKDASLEHLAGRAVASLEARLHLPHRRPC